MEETLYTVTHETNEYPSGLKTAEEMSEILMGDMSAERITELADAGYLPHYRIDGGPPKFKHPEVKRWVANNLLGRNEGRSLSDAIRVVPVPPEILDKPPLSISNIQNLKQMPTHGYCPGVYFLCKGDEVVYVGQSVTPSARIATHNDEGKKDFDRVYLLPTPMSDLDDMEAAFIQHLRPKFNGVIKGSANTIVSPKMSKPKEEILGAVMC